MKAHIEKARAGLGDLASLAAKTDATEKRILAAAEVRLKTVQADIDKAQPGIEAASDADQDKYLELVAERGKLNTVIARARKALE